MSPSKQKLKALCLEADRVIPIGEYGLRCCVELDWFVYKGGQMLFNTTQRGFACFEEAYEALVEYKDRTNV